METEIKNTAKEVLDYTFHGDPTDSSMLIIVGHGVTGDKDREWAVGLCEALEAEGYNSLRMSFSGNGKSDGKFADSTITKEVKDLKAVVNAAENAGYHRIAYVGHSMGGAVGVLAASRDDRIELLVSLAGMVETADFVKREFGDQKPGAGFMWPEDKGEEFPLSKAFVDDLESIKNILPKCEKIEVPFLVVHGDKDDVVPVDEGYALYQGAFEPKEIVVLEGVDHVFSGDGLPKMTEAVVSWFKGQMI